jgi:hypothetical protein
VLTVSDYIVREIASDELSFDDKVCAAIFGEFRFHVEHGIFPGDKQFVKHEDPEISRFSADLLSDSYELSKIWNKHTFVETEEMKLKESVPDCVLKFKGDKIKVLLKEVMVQLEEAVKNNDLPRIGLLQKRDQNLKVALRMISKKLGDRILI